MDRMARLLVVGAAWALGAINAAALDVRAAGDQEIIIALQGCWNQERTLEQNKYEQSMLNSPFASIPYQASACFGDDGVMDSGWIGGYEGMEGQGHMRCRTEKYVCTAPATPTFGFSARTILNAILS